MTTSSIEQFFEKPILNSPYEYPDRHWELDEDGQPTNQIIPKRRRAKYITPISKPKKRGKNQVQGELLLYSEDGLSNDEQQYDPTGNINSIQERVEVWRQFPNVENWQVTPETSRLLQHWRYYSFQGIRPFSVRLRL